MKEDQDLASVNEAALLANGGSTMTWTFDVNGSSHQIYHQGALQETVRTIRLRVGIGMAAATIVAAFVLGRVV